MGVHERHCCVVHGCKYNEDGCPVATKATKQEQPCILCKENVLFKDDRTLAEIARQESIYCDLPDAVDDAANGKEVSRKLLAARLQFLASTAATLDVKLPAGKLLFSLREMKEQINTLEKQLT